MAEMFGRATGYCRGKGGTMHIADDRVRHARRQRHRRRRARDRDRRGAPACACRATTPSSVCFFGDGASNQGIFHEAANIAAVWRCRSSSSARTTGCGDLDAVHARRVNVPDIASPRRRATASPARRSTATTSSRSARRPSAAVERARAGDGPDADRGEDLPHHAALRRDAERQPAARGARAVARARPDRASASGCSTTAPLDADGVAEIDARGSRRSRGRDRASRSS